MKILSILNTLQYLAIVVGVFAIIYILAEKKYFFEYLNNQEGCHASEVMYYDINVSGVNSTEFLEPVPSLYAYSLSISNSNIETLQIPERLKILTMDNVFCNKVDPEKLQHLEFLYIRNGNVNLDFIGKLKSIKRISIYGRNYADIPDLSRLENIISIVLDGRASYDDYLILRKIFPDKSIGIHLYYPD